MTEQSGTSRSGYLTKGRPHRIVLVGGGHTHALVLRALDKRPIQNADITLINPASSTPYSGMMPGYISGHYTREALEIDLVHIARQAGANLIEGSVVGLAGKHVVLATGETISFDLMSLDVGVTSELRGLKGFKDHAVAARPFANFVDIWDAYRVSAGPKQIVIIGAGLAGVELAMAIKFALRFQKDPVTITLVDRSNFLSSSRNVVQHQLRRVLNAFSITIVENDGVEEVAVDHIMLSSGRELPANFILGATGAMPHRWLGSTGLNLQNGFVVVDRYLQTNLPGVFAVGDCAQSESDPRRKAGIYAVRQAPVLLENIRRVLSGLALTSFQPQTDYLKLISLGDKIALGEKYGIAMSGRWVWYLKDHIDRRFMRQFSSS